MSPRHPEPRPTEQRHPKAPGLQALPPAEALSHLLDAQLAAAAEVRSALPAIASAAEAGARALRAGGRLAYAGAGSSGLMALADALELAGTFGIPPERTPILFAGGASALLAMTGAVEDDPDLAARDLAATAFTPDDCLVAVSASGGTPYTLAVAEGAKAAGATLIALVNVPDGALARIADIPILIDTGPELLAGSTRMGAGTAAKIALNMLSTLAGSLLGHVHDGFMVNLVADNAKLRDRAARITAEISGADILSATSALDASGGEVKPAVLLAAGAPDLETAYRLLVESGGHLGPALARLREP